MLERGGQRGGKRGGMRSSDSFWFMHRIQGKLAAMAEKIAGSSFAIPSDPELSWALCSSLQTLSAAGLDPGAGKAFEDLTEFGDAVFIFDDVIIYASQREFSSAFADAVERNLAIIRRYLDR